MNTEAGNTAPEPAWRTLAEFSLPSVAGSERKAMDLVARVVASLRLPQERLLCLKTAVAEATMNATEHGNQYRPDLPVTIKVLISDSVVTVRISDHGSDGMFVLPEPPDIEAKLAGRQSPRGWGFFLIEKLVDEMIIESDEARHTIQLYLYLEGDPSTARPGEGKPGEEEK